MHPSQAWSSPAPSLGPGFFRVELDWRDARGNSGPGKAVPLTGDTGYFYFLNPANVEVAVKVLDGRGLNGHFWVFYGALSNVRYEIRLTDTGQRETYVNPLGTFASAGDTETIPSDPSARWWAVRGSNPRPAD